MISSKIINNILKKKKLFIIGRGPSARFINKFKGSIYYIGHNVSQIFGKKVDYNYKKQRLINQKKRLKVGSIYYSLYELLFVLNEKLKNIKPKKKIFLFGFDFRKVSRDDDLDKKNIAKSKLQQLIDVNSQLIAFEHIKKNFSNIVVKRAAFGMEADVSAKNLKDSTNKKSQDFNIVAEVTTNHQGDTNKLINIIEGCVSAKCNYIKFQRRDVDNFYSKRKLNLKYKTPISNTFFEYRKKLELTDEQLEIIKNYEKKGKIKVIFSALDYLSYKQLKKKGFSMFKIPSTISEHKKYIKEIANENLSKIVISTGMTNQNYINYILKLFKKFQKIYLLHAVSAYPTYFKDMNLNVIKNYVELSKNYKNIVPGYSSHDVGELGCMLAIAAGAKMIEKHVKIGVTDWMHFDDTAIDIYDELPTFVNKLNKINIALGDGKKIIHFSEHHKYFLKKQ